MSPVGWPAPRTALRLALWSAIILQVTAAFLVLPWDRGGDTPGYLRLAESLSHGHYGSVTDLGFQQEAVRPPGYPVLLWMLHHVLGLPLGAVAALQLGMYIASLLLISKFLERYRNASEVFLGLASIYIFTAFYVSALLAEGVALLLVSVIAILIASTAKFSLKHCLALGLLCGVGALFRPDLVLLPVLIAAIVAVRSLQLGNRKQALANALVVLCSSALTLAPYAAWNYTTFGRFTPLPVAGAVGSSLYLATWQNELPQEDIQALYEKRATARAVEAGLIQEVSRLNARIGAHPLTAPWSPTAYNSPKTQIASVSVLASAAVERIKADPAAYANHVVTNTWKLWNTSAFPASTPAWAVAILKIVSGVVLLLGLAGALLSLLKPSGWPLLRSQVLIFLYVPAVHVWLHTEARYTAAIRPLLLMYAAVFIVWAVRKLRQSETPRVSAGL